MKKEVLNYGHLEARRFFLKQESYCSFELPKYFIFQELLDKISQEIEGNEFKSYYKSRDKPCNHENVNYKFFSNKNGKFAWRPLQLIHPAIYVSLVHQITEENNWRFIVEKFREFGSNPRIKCLSLPLETENELSDKATTINYWWHAVEQKSIELSLTYEYVLHTDIAECYDSIYTHSIAWALHTKEEAKQKRTESSLIGNLIDRYIQDMSFGQTNGIPQGSALMDLIAEMVLGFANSELSKKIQEVQENSDSKDLKAYEILRYRDDYRIFTNNPQDADLIMKLLTEVLIDLGLQLNSQKTITSNNVVVDSFKPDKLYWTLNQRHFTKLQDHLLFLHDFSCKYPNSGALCKGLDKFFVRVNKKKKGRENTLVLISILVDIMYKNPRTYPIAAAILSQLISWIESIDEKLNILTTIINRFRKLPNIGYLEIWIQRFAIKVNKDIVFEEKICKTLSSSNETIQIWNSDWIGSTTLKSIINNKKIVDQKIVKEMGDVIEEDEVRLFNSKNNYY